MALEQIIRRLKKEQSSLDEMIASLEHLKQVVAVAQDGAAKRRGRKSMGEDERREVSARMKEFWAKRRRARSAEA